MPEDQEISRPMKVFQVFWPVVALAITGGAYAVSAMAQSTNVERRVDIIEQYGAPVTRERLARIETQMVEQSKQLDRIEEIVSRGSQ